MNTELTIEEKDQELLSYTYSPLFLTGFELREVFTETGASIRLFAEHISRSDNFVRQSLGDRFDTPVPTIWVEKLRAFIGTEAYEAALARVRSRRQNYTYYRELHKALRREFAAKTDE